MSKIIPFSGVTSLDLPPDQVLEQATDHLESVIVIGYTKEGEEYFCSSLADGGEVLWLLERFKKQLLDIGENND